MRSKFFYFIILVALTLTSCGQKHNISEFINSELSEIREDNVHSKNVIVYEVGDNNPLLNEYLIQIGDEYLLYNSLERRAKNTASEYAAGTSRAARQNPFKKDITYNAVTNRIRYGSQASECSHILDSIPVGTAKEEGLWVFLGYTYSMFGKDGYTGGALYHMNKDGKTVIKKYNLQTSDNVVSTIFEHKDFQDYKSYKIELD